VVVTTMSSFGVVVLRAIVPSLCCFQFRDGRAFF
jgi:hypothetical protein